MAEWEVVETKVHPLRVNGKPTTQEEIRANADATLDAWPKASSVECGMAETILSLLDLLEASQDLISYLTTGYAVSEDKAEQLYRAAAS
jgi:hypothetical protein